MRAGCMSCLAATCLNVQVQADLERDGCDCVNVEIGSYTNQVVRPIPEHMADYRAARVADGLSDSICIDACMVAEIEALWAQGIRTTGCCCGHKKAPAYIGVFYDDIPRMKAMGYEVLPNFLRPGDEDSFEPKGVMK